MHKSAAVRREWFFNTYKSYLHSISSGCIRILDVGGKNYNDIWKDVFMSSNCKKDILDIQESPEVNIVPKDPYHWEEIPDETYDLVVSLNTLQHVDFFWLTVREIKRVLKKNGIFFMVAPSNRYNGKYPVVNWAFNRDGLWAIAKWAGLEVVDASVAGIPSMDAGPEWDYPLDDAVLIAIKGQKKEIPFFEMVEKLRFQRYYKDRNRKAEMLAGWLELYQTTGQGISQWFEKHQISRVNLYGAGVPGKLLTEELISAGIEILNVLDRNPSKKCMDFICCSPDSVSMRDREALTVITMSEKAACKEVYDSLSDKGFRPIKLLSEIVEDFFPEQTRKAEGT